MNKKIIPAIALSFSSAVFIAACSNDTQEEMSSNAEQMSQSAENMTENATDSMAAAGDEAMNTAEEAGEEMADAGEQAMDSAEEAGDEVADASEEAMDSAEQTAENAGDYTSDALQDTENAVSGAIDTAGQVMADSAITGEIKAKYIAEADLAALEIDVDTQDGAVTLKGSVPSEPAKSLAEEIASNVEGVKSVENDLDVEAAAQ